MAYQPYTGPVVDLDGPHYHNWFLDTIPIVSWEGESSTMALIPAMRAYANRMTAHNHAKQSGQRFRVMKCKGGDECPMMNPYGTGIDEERERLGKAVADAEEALEEARLRLAERSDLGGLNLSEGG